MLTTDHSQFNSENVEGGDTDITGNFHNVAGVTNNIADGVDSDSDTVSYSDNDSNSDSSSNDDNDISENSNSNVIDELWSGDPILYLCTYSVEQVQQWLEDDDVIDNTEEHEITESGGDVEDNNITEVNTGTETDIIANINDVENNIPEGFNGIAEHNSPHVHIVANNTVQEVDDVIEGGNLIREEDDDVIDDNYVAKVHDIVADDNIPNGNNVGGADNYIQINVPDGIACIMGDNNVDNIVEDNFIDLSKSNNVDNDGKNDNVDDIGRNNDVKDIEEGDNIDNIAGHNDLDDIDEDDDDNIDEDDDDTEEDNDDNNGENDDNNEDNDDNNGENDDDIEEDDNVDDIGEGDNADDAEKDDNVDDVGDDDDNVGIEDNNSVDAPENDNGDDTGEYDNVDVINEDDNVDNIKEDNTVNNVAGYYNSPKVENAVGDDNAAKYENISECDDIAEVCVTEHDDASLDSAQEVDAIVNHYRVANVDDNNDRSNDESVSTDDQNSDSDNSNASGSIKYHNNCTNVKEVNNTAWYHDTANFTPFYRYNYEEHQPVAVSDSDIPNTNDCSEVRGRGFYSHGIFACRNELMDLLGPSQESRRRALSLCFNGEARKMNNRTSVSAQNGQNQHIKVDHLTSASELQTNRQELTNSADDQLGVVENIAPLPACISGSEMDGQSTNDDIVNTDTVDSAHYDTDRNDTITGTVCNTSVRHFQGSGIRYPPNLPDLIPISQWSEGYHGCCKSKIYFCGICDKRCASRYIVLAHLRCFHYKRSFLFCDTCTTVVDCRRAMVNHLKCHR